MLSLKGEKKTMNPLKLLSLKLHFKSRFIKLLNIIKTFFSIISFEKKIKIEYKHFLRKKVYLFGLTQGPANMGDIAQFYCISDWLVKQYPNAKLFCYQTYQIKFRKYRLLKTISKYIHNEDLIFFMSGYNTHDIGGGYQEQMHQKVIETFVDNKIIILPQTVLFREKENENKAREIYSDRKNILFFARDKVSFDIAKRLFKGVQINQLFDIVSTLISNIPIPALQREGIALCYRNDVESFYSVSDFCEMENNLKDYDKVSIIDTVKRKIDSNIALNDPYKYISMLVSEFACHKITITDKLHGTLFSLIAGTPVIVLKTQDQKVIECANDFSKIYPDYVFIADGLEKVYEIVKWYFSTEHNKELHSIQKEYFDVLNNDINQWMINSN